jgi:hypothetical protein
MSISSITSAGMPLSIYDEAAVAFKHTLRERPPLMVWTGGNIERCETLAVPAGFVGARIIVSNLPPQMDEGLGNCTPVTLPIVLSYVWEQFQEYLPDDHPSIYTVLDECIRAAVNNQTLKAPQTGNRSLVQKLEGIRVAGEPRYIERDRSVVIIAAFIFDWKMRIDVKTGKTV